jgi:hypothetical protein
VGTDPLRQWIVLDRDERGDAESEQLRGGRPSVWERDDEAGLVTEVRRALRGISFQPPSFVPEAS